MKLDEINKSRIKAGVQPSRISDSKNDIVKFIKRNCTQILSYYEKRPLNLLYSGKGSFHEVLFGKSINGRKPLGTHPNIHRKINNVLKQCGFKALRNNSIFCISIKTIADDYGAPYVIFPLNGFDYSWCKPAHDLTMQYRIGTNDFALSNRFVDDLNSLSPQEFVKKYEFENNVGLEDALWMGNEILIRGSYVAIRENSPLIKELIPSFKSEKDEMDDEYREELDYDPYLEESSSCGSTSSSSIATVNTGLSNGPIKGQFFGGDPNSSIYDTIKKNRKKRNKDKI